MSDRARSGSQSRGAGVKGQKAQEGQEEQEGQEGQGQKNRTDRLTIGRSPDCGLCLADHLVSRLHAEVFRSGEDWYIADLGSRHGTTHNGERIRGSASLRTGDRVSIGPIVLVFEVHESGRPMLVPPSD